MANAYLNEDQYSEEEPNYTQRALRGALLNGGLGALYGGGVGLTLANMPGHADGIPAGYQSAAHQNPAGAALIGALLGGGAGALTGALGNAASGYAMADLNKRNAK
jgi:hypothetical protein